MTKSQNKHNRIHGSAAPLHEDLPLLIESGEITPTQDIKIRGKRLADDFGWDKEETTKIWCFGPDNTGPNMVVDITKGVQYMNELKESIVSSFQWASKQGILCDENMRGMRFNIFDCELHADAIHRGGGQIMPAARRLFYALELLSAPTLVEPIFSCEITAPSDCMGGVYQSLNQRRGQVIEEIQIAGTPLNLVLILSFRSKHISPSLNPLASPVCSEETHKEKPSPSVSSIIGRSSRDSLSLMQKQENSFFPSEREKPLNQKSPFLPTTSTECDCS
jgi:translation elongation factor EF-G